MSVSQDTITVFTCRDCFDDMMSCIYTAWASRLGHSHVRLQTEPIGTPELFCTYRHVEPDAAHTASVVRTIQRKISWKAYQMVYQAAMSTEENKLDAIYRFLTLGFQYGAAVMDYLQSPLVLPVFEMSRKVSNESHSFREFVRFSAVPTDSSEILVSHISPKSNVLTLLAPAFADRLPSEHWMIVDDGRRTAIVHPANQDYYLTNLTRQDLVHLALAANDPYNDLWKTFFQHIGINERTNPHCQRNMLPLWYRKHMPEFEASTSVD